MEEFSEKNGVEKVINIIKSRLRKTRIFRKIIWRVYTSSIFEPKNSPSSSKIKQRLVIQLAKENKIRVFIETGTYIGKMLEAVNKYFDILYSIEIDKKLYDFCKKKFSDNKKINLLYGNSANTISKVLSKVKSPSLFWLDAHFSGGITSRGKNKTPIEMELKTILKNWNLGNIILMDDARKFNGKNDYPTFNKVKEIALKKV